MINKINTEPALHYTALHWTMTEITHQRERSDSNTTSKPIGREQKTKSASSNQTVDHVGVPYVDRSDMTWRY